MIDMYQIISKYLAGESSETENRELEAWRRLNEENERIFQEKIWNKILTNIKQVRIVKGYSRTVLVRTTSIAAFFTLIIGFSASFLYNTVYNNKSVENIAFRTRWGEKAEITLPDGSVVLLISGTEKFNWKDKLFLT